MTAWPWMNGVEVAISDPIPLVNTRDKRPSVKDLIEGNQKSIDQVKQSLREEALYDPQKHDDLWILRFLLSHKKKPKAATKAAKSTLAFRQTHKLDLEDIRPYPPTEELTKSEALKRYLEHCAPGSINFVVPDVRRGVVGFLAAAGIDQHALVKNVSQEDWHPSFMYISEWTFQWLDYVTRTTGRLTKSIRLVDATGLSMKAINMEHLKRDGHAMGVMEDCYPQLLHGVFIIGAPSWIQAPWRVVRPILPERLVEKFDFVAPTKREHEVERLLAHISLQNLPAKFGGLNKVCPVDIMPPKLS